VLDYGECFLQYPYETTLELVNDTDFPAKFYLPIQEETARYVYTYSAAMNEGVVEAHSVAMIQFQVCVLRLGEIGFPIFVHTAGNEDNPLVIDISARGIGPRVSISPAILDWGKVPVLEKKEMTLHIQNKSPIEAHYRCELDQERYPVFRILPTSGTIPANDIVEIKATACLDDTYHFNNILKIIIGNSTAMEVKLTAKGYGSTIQCSDVSKTLDFGTMFTGQQCSRRFTFVNYGRRTQYLTWIHGDEIAYSTGRRQSEERPKVFEVVPNRAIVKSGGQQEICVTGSSTVPAEIRERLLCFSHYEMNPMRKQIFQCSLAACYVEPSIRCTPSSLSFSTYASHLEVAKPVEKELVLRNASPLPVTFSLSFPQFFSVTPLRNEWELASSEAMKVKVKYLPVSTTRLCRRDKGKLTISYEGHSKQDYIEMTSDLLYPNLQIDQNQLDFGPCGLISENFRTLTMVNNGESDVFYSWYMKDEANAHFEIFPNRGIVRGGETESIEFRFVTGVKSEVAKAIAVCYVAGGPFYEVNLSGEVSKEAFHISPTVLDFGTMSFNQILCKRLNIKNTGNVAMNFKLLIPDQFAFLYQHVFISPSSGFIAAGVSLSLKIYFAPILDGSVNGEVHIQLGDTDPVAISIRGRGRLSTLNIESESFKPKQNFHLTESEMVKDKILGAAEYITNRFSSKKSHGPSGTQKMMETLRENVLTAVKRNNKESMKKFPNLRFLGSAYIGVCRKAMKRTDLRDKNRSKESVLALQELESIASETNFCNFGECIPGYTYTRNFNLYNTTTEEISLELLLDGPDDDIDVSPRIIKNLNSMTSAPVQLVLHPRAIGDIKRTVTIRPSIGSARYIQVSASVGVPKFEVSSNSIDFSEVFLGQRKTCYLNLRNRSSVSLQWKSSISTQLRNSSKKEKGLIVPIFSMEPATGQLRTNESQVVKIFFVPQADRPYRETVRLTVDGMDVAQIVLIGTGLSLKIKCEPNSVNIGPVLPYGDPVETKFSIANYTNFQVEIFPFDFESNCTSVLSSDETAKQLLERPLEDADNRISAAKDNYRDREPLFIVVHGHPFSGKTSQAQYLSSLYNIPVIDSEEFFKIKECDQQSTTPPSSAPILIIEDVSETESMSEKLGSISKPTNEKMLRSCQMKISSAQYSRGFILDGLESVHLPNPQESLQVLLRALGPQHTCFVLFLTLDIVSVRERNRDLQQRESLKLKNAVMSLQALDEYEYEKMPLNEQFTVDRALIAVKKLQRERNAMERARRKLEDRNNTQEEHRRTTADDEKSKRKKESPRRRSKLLPKVAHLQNSTANFGKLRRIEDEAQSSKSNLDLHGDIPSEADSFQTKFDQTGSLINLLNNMVYEHSSAIQAKNVVPVVDAKKSTTKPTKLADVVQTVTLTSSCTKEKDQEPITVYDGGSAIVFSTFESNHNCEAVSTTIREFLDKIAYRTIPYLDEHENLPISCTDLVRPLVPTQAAFDLLKFFSLTKQPLNEDEDASATTPTPSVTGRPPSAAGLGLPTINNTKPELQRRGSRIFRPPEDEKSTRFLLRAGEKRELTLKFASTVAETFRHRFVFGANGFGEPITLDCIASCDYPRFQLDYKKMIHLYCPPKRMKDKKKVEVTVPQPVFNAESSLFNFGPLFINKLREQITPATVSHRFVLPIINPFTADVKVSFYLKNDLRDVFLMDTAYLDIPAKESRQLEIFALPKVQGLFEDVLIVCIKDNPEPTLISLSCYGHAPAVHVTVQPPESERVLLNRTMTRKMVIKNPLPLIIGWKLVSVEASTSEEFVLSLSEGTLAPDQEEKITITFKSPKAGIFKRQWRLEAFDRDDPNSSIPIETLSFNAEAYDVILDVHFPKNDNSFDFGILKPFEDAKQTLALRNKGKYDLHFRFYVAESPWSSCFHIQPQRGILQPNEKAINVQALFRAGKDMVVEDKSSAKCVIIEPATGEVVGSIPIKVLAETVSSKYKIEPSLDLNFGIVGQGQRSVKSLIIENTGQCDFTVGFNKTEDSDTRLNAKGKSGSRGKLNEIPGSARPSRKESARPSEGLNISHYTFIPLGGTVQSGTKLAVTIEFHPLQVGKFDEMVEIDISDRESADPILLKVN
jgi:hypothetical protein